MLSARSTKLLRTWRVAALALVASAGCVEVAGPPDYSGLRIHPVLSEAAEDQAAQANGSALSSFAWACNDYAAYIGRLRGGLPEEPADPVE